MHETKCRDGDEGCKRGEENRFCPLALDERFFDERISSEEGEPKVVGQEAVARAPREACLLP